MFANYPKIWAPTRFWGLHGPKERVKCAQTFLVAQAKKVRAYQKAKEKPPGEPNTSATKRKRTDQAEATGPPPKIDLMNWLHGSYKTQAFERDKYGHMRDSLGKLVREKAVVADHARYFANGVGCGVGDKGREMGLGDLLRAEVYHNGICLLS